MSIDKLNPMQISAYHTILEEKTTFLLSKTGSGKTLAYLLPLLEILDINQKTVQCLILAPSRELAMQIDQVWKSMGTGFKSNLCYGGHDMAIEIQNLSTPPALLIGTPGRVFDHISRFTFDTKGINTLILDEFDKSLDLGFHDQMAYIIGNLSQLNKRVLVSATNGVAIPDFVGFTAPVTLNFISETDENLDLEFKLVHSTEKDKINSLYNLLCNLNSDAALIFCNHRESAERTAQLLNEMGIYATFYHGGMDQDDREKALVLFRNGSVKYLITTDLAARGLDIPQMKHVIHYHLPLQAHEFTHRNGRTARMHNTGTIYLLLHNEEKRPSYLPKSIEEFEIDENASKPTAPDFITMYISGGKKNKLNKVDIVGTFTQKGGLQKDEIGLIEVKDFMSFVAVKRSAYETFLQKIKDEKIKGKKYKIELARLKG